MKNFLTQTLQKRILSAIILAPLTLFALVYGGWAFWALVIIAFIFSVFEFYNLSKMGTSFLRDILFGVLYLFIAYSSFLMIRFSFEHGTWLTLALMLTVWACDIGAYFTGKMIGGAKMAPAISPKKTWAGLIGGVLCSALTLVIFSAFMPSTLSIIFAAIIGVIIAVAGQLGDLYISTLKRRVGAKDTGNVIPGHGGVLDRIDSLLLASPVFLILMWGMGQ